jgi:hypothetical protein
MGAKLDYEEIKTLSHTIPKEIVYMSLILNMYLMLFTMIYMTSYIFNFIYSV